MDSSVNSGPDPVYKVYIDIHKPGWVNRTVIAAGRLGREYPKTFGHYHSKHVDEIYHRVEGEGTLILQKKHFKNGVWVPEKVDEVLLITVNFGDAINIKPEYGHSWSNTGKEPLVLYDDWKISHHPSDYEAIEKLHGLAYYLVEKDGQPEAVPNQNYKNLPKPQWLTLGEFNAKS